MKIAWALIFGIVLWGCAKKPPTATPDIKYIVAGDSTGSYVHHVALNNAIINDLYLDIDKDGINDFQLLKSIQNSRGTLSTGYVIYPSNQSSYVCVDSSVLTIVLKVGDTIQQSSGWINGNNILFLEDSNELAPGPPFILPTVHWVNISDGYVGFKIIKNSQTLWGWMHIGGIKSKNFYIKDYAYTEY